MNLEEFEPYEDNEEDYPEDESEIIPPPIISEDERLNFFKKIRPSSEDGLDRDTMHQWFKE